jgi:hypothetical protein
MDLNNNIEVEVSDDSGSESRITTAEQSPGFRNQRKTIEMKTKINSSSKPKRRCTFKKEWMNNPDYKGFLKECRIDKYLAHCSICNSNFSIANGGKYLINRHMEQSNHKRLSDIDAKEKCKIQH